MFLKPYKIKSTSTLKNSDKKQLLQHLQRSFPAVTEVEFKELVPAKASCSCLKIMVHSGEVVTLYAVDGSPLAVETARGLLPALPALWKLPRLLPTVTVQAPLLTKIAGGAPLYLPGLVMSPGGVGFPMFGAGAALSANTSDNGAAALVGYALIGSADMLLRAQGSCMEMVFVYGDLLTREQRLTKALRPTLAHGDGAALDRDMQQLSLQPTPATEQWPALGPRPPNTPREIPDTPRVIPQTANTPRMIPESVNISEAKGSNGDLDERQEKQCEPASESCAAPSMDDLLKHSLLSFLKQRAKHIALPLKVNLLYKNHLIPLCPAGHTLDVKQSSYKKIGKFLDAMQQEGLLEIRETERGVWDVTAVNMTHPSVTAHRVTKDNVTQRDVTTADYTPPQIKEVYCVTAAVQDILRTKKGTPLSASEVRSLVKQHVLANNLQAASGRVIADQLIANIAKVQEQECVTWEHIMTSAVSLMTAATLLRHDDGAERLIKQRLEPVTMNVVTRSGNKKVTLVSNLQPFGLCPQYLARSAQSACGAACGVTRSPGAKADQLMLQGDQTTFVARLLIEKYGLPKKFLEGADKALNKKK